MLAGIDGQDGFTIPGAGVHPFFALDQKILGATHAGPEILREALDIAATGKIEPMVETFAAARHRRGGREGRQERRPLPRGHQVLTHHTEAPPGDPGRFRAHPHHG